MLLFFLSRGAKLYILQMLPTVAYLDNPSTSFAAKFVHTSLNKNRCSINRVLVSWGNRSSFIALLYAFHVLCVYHPLSLFYYVFGTWGFLLQNQLFFHFLFSAFWKLISFRTADSSMLNVFNFITGRKDYSDYVIDFTPYNQIICKY